MTQNMIDFETDIAIITETWIPADNMKINELLEDYENVSNYALIRRDRIGACRIKQKLT